MAADARNHHYVPQAYLKGFTEGGSKKSNFVVYDVKTGSRFETKPRNVCAERDFNRVNIPGVDPNVVESDMGKFEALIPPAIHDIDNRNSFEGDSRDTILNLIAILATRHPDRREVLRKFHAQIAKVAMSVVMSKPEIYNRTTISLEQSGIQSSFAKVPYEQMRRFVDGGEYAINVGTEHHLRMEATAYEAALDCLAQRQWTLYRAVDGHFITSDLPVCLTWRNPDQVPPFYRASPGHAMRDTEVVFPLSKQLALIGTFDGEDGAHQASTRLVGAVNSRVMAHARRHIYSAKRSFPMMDAECNMISGADIFKRS
jgi:hypothetical protein